MKNRTKDYLILAAILILIFLFAMAAMSCQFSSEPPECRHMTEDEMLSVAIFDGYTNMAQVDFIDLTQDVFLPQFGSTVENYFTFTIQRGIGDKYRGTFCIEGKDIP